MGKKTVNTLEENPDRTSCKSGKITLWRCHHCYRKCCESYQAWKGKACREKQNKTNDNKNYPDVLYDFTEFIDRANQGNCERDCEYDKNKVDGEEFQDMDLGETGELTDITPEELTDDLMEMSALIPVPDDEEVIEEAAPENKWTLDNVEEGFWLFKTAFDFFYDIDSSVIWALKLNQMAE